MPRIGYVQENFGHLYTTEGLQFNECDDFLLFFSSVAVGVAAGAIGSNLLINKQNKNGGLSFPLYSPTATKSSKIIDFLRQGERKNHFSCLRIPPNNNKTGPSVKRAVKISIFTQNPQNSAWDAESRRPSLWNRRANLGCYSVRGEEMTPPSFTHKNACKNTPLPSPSFSCPLPD